MNTQSFNVMYFSLTAIVHAVEFCNESSLKFAIIADPKFCNVHQVLLLFQSDDKTAIALSDYVDKLVK